MYKITNKETGFIQYRNAMDAANFVQRTKGCITDKYKIEKVNEIDGDEIQDIAYAIIGGICLIVLICIFFTPNF